jgi:hypothetical protein
VADQVDIFGIDSVVIEFPISSDVFESSRHWFDRNVNEVDRFLQRHFTR